jgi:hypothetical protein
MEFKDNRSKNLLKSSIFEAYLFVIQFAYKKPPPQMGRGSMNNNQQLLTQNNLAKLLLHLGYN